MLKQKQKEEVDTRPPNVSSAILQNKHRHELSEFEKTIEDELKKHDMKLLLEVCSWNGGAAQDYANVNNITKSCPLSRYSSSLNSQIDQKVSDQQVTLCKAAVPGFYVSNNSHEVRLQMYLLEFIQRLAKVDLSQQ